MISKEATILQHTLPISFTKTARAAFFHVLQHLNQTDNRKILLPAYIGITDKEGSGVFDPVKQSNTAFDFYSVNTKLEANIDDISQHIKSGNYKALLLIHYFGFPQIHTEVINALCENYNVLLIEDCAHTLQSSYKGKKLGSFGDLSFNSIHKLIPTADGGILQCNNPKYHLTNTSEQELSINTLHTYLRTDIEKTSEIRRKNYKQYLSLWTDLKGITLMQAQLNEGVVPLNFPILIENGLREQFYFKLIDKGVITVALYYRMIEEINKEKYPTSYEVSNSILNLPVHQDIEVADINLIAEKVIETHRELF